MKNAQELFQDLIKFNQDYFAHINEFMKKQKDLMDSYKCPYEKDQKEYFAEYQKSFMNFNFDEFKKTISDSFKSGVYFDNLNQTAEQMKVELTQKYKDGMDKITKMTEETIQKVRKIQDDFIETSKNKMK